jgi:formylglycine-generating enzyme required for sulfatase activity
MPDNTPRSAPAPDDPTRTPAVHPDLTDDSPPPALRPGSRPVPEYALVEFLGAGQFGQVWKARDDSGFEVALKFIRLDTRTKSAELRRLDLMKNVRHPHVVPMFHSWNLDDWLVLALELGDQNLSQRFDEAEKRGEVGIPRAELLEYVREAAKGLDYLHGRKIQHRDVKPANLLLVGGSIKVADFGLTKLLEATIATNTNRGMTGTPAFAAPEVWGGKTSKHSDQFALAVSWCQLRGARLPFGGDDWKAIAWAITSGAADLSMIPEAERPAVERALAKDPDRRWPSCREFVEALHSPEGSGGRLRGRPAPLDCTGVTGVSAADVRRAQEAWAQYLGRKVEETVEIADGLPVTFVLVPPGRFRMGSPEGEKDREGHDETPHTVELSQPFDLGKYEVTQAQYRALVSRIQYEELKDPDPSRFKGADRPVEQVSWAEAAAFARELTRLRADKFVYRLPTEAEWEYACRGGRPFTHPFGIGDGHSLSSREANFDGKYPYGAAAEGKYLEQTSRVGSYAANPLGLFDMHGNVWEWCADRFGPYPRDEVSNPTGAVKSPHRVLRGGGWINLGKYCRAAFRRGDEPGERNDALGFRLARTIPPRAN